MEFDTTNANLFNKQRESRLWMSYHAKQLNTEHAGRIAVFAAIEKIISWFFPRSYILTGWLTFAFLPTCLSSPLAWWYICFR